MSACGQGWSDFAPSKKCFKPMSISMSQDQGKSVCADLGGNLVRLSSPEEQLFLFGKFYRFSFIYKLLYTQYVVWIFAYVDYEMVNKSVIIKPWFTLNLVQNFPRLNVF